MCSCNPCSPQNHCLGSSWQPRDLCPTSQHSTAQHSTARHSTAQHSTARHSSLPAARVTTNTTSRLDEWKTSRTLHAKWPIIQDCVRPEGLNEYQKKLRSIWGIWYYGYIRNVGPQYWELLGRLHYSWWPCPPSSATAAVRISQWFRQLRIAMDHMTMSILCAACWEPKTHRCTVWYDTIRYDTIRYDTIRYDTIRYDTIRYDTIRYDTIRYDTILYYTILYYTILYYTILYYTILYYTILYYTILYYTMRYDYILHYAALC